MHHSQRNIYSLKRRRLAMENSRYLLLTTAVPNLVAMENSDAEDGTVRETKRRRVGFSFCGSY